jgi:flavin reductase (DIM6/NTAB) family NADH-FMN oxidoreductase RutF
VIDDAFDDLMGMLDYPVFVVTTVADGEPAGCLVSLASQTSVHPPSFVISLTLNSHTAEVASRSEFLAVHMLPRRQQALAELFGTQTGREVNKFERCSWRPGPQGMPILDETVAWFVARTVSRSDVGDHVVYLLAPIAGWAPESEEDLLYLSDIEFDVDDDDGGHEDPQRLYVRERGDARRYNVPRFTLDVP